jgi:hypothetical protein
LEGTVFLFKKLNVMQIHQNFKKLFSLFVVDVDVLELRPPAGLSFIPQTMYEYGAPME